MPDFKKMTVERLRELARKVLGPAQSRLKTKGELVRALEEAGQEPPARVKEAGARAAAATGKAVRAAKGAGKAARQGARTVARAGKAAAGAAAEGARAGTKVARERKGGKAAAAAGAVAGAVAGVAAAAKRARAGGGSPGGGSRAVETRPDPEGYFVARVRGEDAVRDAPHAMSEAMSDAPPPPWDEGVGEPAYEEGLGELPPGYGDDAFVALPRDPKTLFVYWDWSRETMTRGFEGLEHARAQLWVYGRTGEGWDRLREIEFALESRGYYVHDLEPGRTYRAEVHAVDGRGHERLIGRASNEVTLPSVGPSAVVDDRFIRIPWEMPLGRLLGPGHPGAPFSDEARALLARLSDWSRFAGRNRGGGSAGGMGGRPSSPTTPFGRSNPGEE
jgi:hypothetical protein